MASASRFVLPYQTVIDATGVPIPGALLFFYISGTDTPFNTYADSNLLFPNKNPVPANAAGMFPSIFLLSAAYKVVLTDSSLNEIWTADPVFGEAAGTGGGNISNIITLDYTVQLSDYRILMDASGGARNVFLPAASALIKGTIYVITKVDSSSNLVTIVPNGSNTIAGTSILPFQYQSIQQQSDGVSTWYAF